MTIRRVKKRHEVSADFQVPLLAKAGSSLTLRIYANKEKLGEIVVGRGSLYWYGRKRQRSKRISWTKFSEMMDRLAYGEQR